MQKPVPSFGEHYNVPRIEEETRLQPRLIAAGVCQEVAQHLWRYNLQMEDQSRIAEWLSERANQVYRHNIPFREKLRGDQGRQHLSSCMRQWLAERLERTSPTLHARLPERFGEGIALNAI